MKRLLNKLPSVAAIAAAAFLTLGATAAQAQDKTITLCWAAWDPANALVELSKDFTTKTGIKMKFEFVPWPNFADRMLNELNSKGKLCDLIIGDSQWIGGAAESGHYVKLNDFFAKEGIKITDFAPATVTGYAEWPKGTPNYWALPAMGDALGWAYRKDWFSKIGPTTTASAVPRVGEGGRFACAWTNEVAGDWTRRWSWRAGCRGSRISRDGCAFPCGRVCGFRGTAISMPRIRG